MIRAATRFRDRDRRLLRDVFLYRVVRRDDLIELGHFRSVARCNHRLAQLVSAGFLRKLEKVNGLAGHQTLYAIGKGALNLLSDDPHLQPDEVNRAASEREGPILVEHSLRVLDFRHCMQKECLSRGIELAEWLCEPECLHEFEYQARPHAPWKQVVIKPDACFLLHVCGRPSRFFLEMDLGHVSLFRFGDKLRRYESYIRCGAFADAYELGEFAVLTVTVGERRLEHLAGLSCSGFKHFVTTWSRIGAEGVLPNILCKTDQPILAGIRGGGSSE